MTNKAISALTAATLPVAGTELIPIWDGAATVKVAISSLGPGLTGIAPSAITGTALVSAAIGTTVQAYDADLTTWAGITPGSGVAAALAINVGTAGAIVTLNGAGGTPSSMTGTNISGTAASLTAGAATVLATARSLWGNSFNGSAAISGDITGGAGNWVVSGGAGVAGVAYYCNASLTSFSYMYSSAHATRPDQMWHRANTHVTESTGGTLFSTQDTNGLALVKGLAVGGATAAASGIAFPATAVAVADVNTLDDYEEGTWTPVLTGTGGSFTHTTQKGFYTKVGRLVTVQFYLSGTKNTVSGNLTITGLPFTPSATAGAYITFRMGLWYMVGGTAMVDVNGFINLGVAVINIYYITAADTGNESNTLSATQLSAGTQFGSEFSYIV